LFRIKDKKVVTVTGHVDMPSLYPHYDSLQDVGNENRGDIGDIEGVNE
jgi:hypothetical protein